MGAGAMFLPFELTMISFLRSVILRTPKFGKPTLLPGENYRAVEVAYGGAANGR